MFKLFQEHKIISLVIVGILVVIVAYVFQFESRPEKEDLSTIKAEVIPEENKETSYQLRLSLGLLPQFLDWAEKKVPRVEDDPRYYESLNGLVAPCCDDHQAYRCCCEEGGKTCNIIKSAKGLTAYLIDDLDYDVESIQASVLQWLRFARSDYYLASELQDRGINPLDYDLTTKGSCYRGLCKAPISEGGCGGMGKLIEPTI